MKKIILIFSFFFAFSIQAQDVHYSQFYNTPLTLNPALTGLVNGNWRISGIYRNQWSVTNNFGNPSYSTPSISFDAPIRLKNSKSALGLGGLILNDKVAGGLLNDFQAAISLSYILGLGQNANHQLSFGLQPFIWNRNFSNDLQFASDINGSGQSQLLDGNSFNHFDVNTGLLYFGNLSDKLNFYLGGSLFNIARPNMGYLQNSSTNFYFRYSAHTGFEIGNPKKLSILPSILFMRQINVDQLNTGIAAGIGIKESTRLLLGLYSRTNGWINNLSIDALIPYIGFEHKGFSTGISYDYTLSDFQDAIGNSNALELSLSYVHNKRNSEEVGYKLFCPRF